MVRGFTLIELLVALTILSILAAVSLPFVEVTVIRTKELELHSALREVRTAIDNFHDDWVNGKISKTNKNVSEDGYPKTLQILVDGVERSIAKGGKNRYLRRIPPDPFSEKENKDPKDDWVIRGYQDELSSTVWGGHDVYDIHSMSDKVAIDGSHYREW
jgi:general secretion pathway protein G